MAQSRAALYFKSDGAQRAMIQAFYCPACMIENSSAPRTMIHSLRSFQRSINR